MSSYSKKVGFKIFFYMSHYKSKLTLTFHVINNRNLGSYFGEIGCLVGGIRRAGVKALTTCEIQALSRRNLNILIMEYPDVGEELKRVAKDRAKVVKEERKNSVPNTMKEGLHINERKSNGDVKVKSG